MSECGSARGSVGGDQDGGERIWPDIELPFTASASEALRLGQVMRSVMVTYPKPETDAQRRAREALRLPMPVFSFLVESVRVGGPRSKGGAVE